MFRLSVKVKLLAIGLSLLGFLSGCNSKPDEVRLVTVTGTALHAGKPVPNIIVWFIPEKGLRSAQVTDSEGKFKPRVSGTQEGVSYGKNKVYVAIKKVEKEDEVGKAEVEKMKKDPVYISILAKYGDINTTPLEYNITGKQDITLNLD